MTTPAPFETIALGDAPPAPSLDALIANADRLDRVFQLYPETVIDDTQSAFADLWCFPDAEEYRPLFAPGPLTSAPVSVRSFNGALVHSQSGIVFDRMGRVVAETAIAEQFRDPSWRRIAPIVEAGAKLAREAAATSSAGPPHMRALFANYGGYTVFGHLMGETIPMAMVFSRWLRSQQMKLLMPPVWKTDMPDQLLQLAGVEPSVQVRSDKAFFWSTGLIVSSTCSADATWAQGPLHHDFARTVKATVPHKAGRRRLFLTRRDGHTTQRRDLVNENELVAALEPLDFEVVNPARLPPRVQIAMCAEADCVVSLMGSVWANMNYMSPGTLAVDLLPKHKAEKLDDYGLSLAKSTGLPYVLIVSPSHGPKAGDIDVTADVPLVVDRVVQGLERVKALRLR